MNLTYGATKIDRIVENAEQMLAGYREDSGYRYLLHQPSTPADSVLLEDLAVTLLVNSQVGWRAAKAVQDRGPELQLASIRDEPLAEASADVKGRVAALIADVALWPGFGASTATKMLHKKRPNLIPILDNQAIFGAYMNPRWLESKSSQDTVKGRAAIREALEWIATDLVRDENRGVWPTLRALEPELTAIQVFDMVWWQFFRYKEPVRPASPV